MHGIISVQLFQLTSDTSCLPYLTGKLHGFHNTLCLCIYKLNIGPGFTCKLFELLQIVLVGLHLKSGSEWPHRNVTLSAMNVKTAVKRPPPHIRYSPKWSRSVQPLITAAPHICRSVPSCLRVQGYTVHDGVLHIYVLLCCRVSCGHRQVVFFIAEGRSAACVFVQQSALFRWWYREFGSCARWGPEGLPYIIHYALAHQAGCKAALLWSHSKKALVISLPLGGQLLEQRRQKLQSTPACSDCSEGERKKERHWERGRESEGTRGLFLGMAGHWFYSWVVVCLVFGTGCQGLRWMGSLLAARVPWTRRPAVSSRRLLFIDQVCFITVSEFGGLCAFKVD